MDVVPARSSAWLHPEERPGGLPRMSDGKVSDPTIDLRSGRQLQEGGRGTGIRTVHERRLFTSGSTTFNVERRERDHEYADSPASNNENGASRTG